MIKCLYCGQDLNPGEVQQMDPETGFTTPINVLRPIDHFDNCPVMKTSYRTYKKVKEWCRGNPTLRKLIAMNMALVLKKKKGEDVTPLIEPIAKILDKLEKMELLPEVE